MAIIALVSPGGSPGVTTTALALALTWPGPAIMAECDPAGGSVLAGMWRGQRSDAGPDMLSFTLAAQRDPAAAGTVLDAAASLPADPGQTRRAVLPAAPDPLAARQIAAAWPRAAAALASASGDVIADLGRYDGASEAAPLLRAAAVVLLICRPDIGQAAAARPRLAALARTRPADAIVLVGKGCYDPRTVARELDIEVAATLPADPQVAAVLTRGDTPRRGFATSPLLRAAGQLAARLADQARGPAAVPAGARQ
jgi:hypothetical protein